MGSRWKVLCNSGGVSNETILNYKQLSSRAPDQNTHSIKAARQSKRYRNLQMLYYIIYLFFSGLFLTLRSYLTAQISTIFPGISHLQRNLAVFFPLPSTLSLFFYYVLSFKTLSILATYCSINRFNNSLCRSDLARALVGTHTHLVRNTYHEHNGRCSIY